MIKTSYDPEADVIQIDFGAKGAVYDDSDEVSPGIMLHVDTRDVRWASRSRRCRSG
jgi:hypothetical protein